MKIALSKAKKILSGLGFKTAGNWPLERVQKSFGDKVKEHADDDSDMKDEDLNKLLAKAIKVANDDEGEFEITDDGEAAAEEKPAKKAAAEEKPAKKAKPAVEAEPEAEEEEGEEEPKAKPAAKPGGGKTVTKAKPAAPAKPAKKAGPPGVRESRSRPYLVGIVIKKHGLDAGITEAMVAEVDEAYGKPNPRETEFAMRNAWHAIRGYVKGKADELEGGEEEEAPAKPAKAKGKPAPEEEEEE